MKRCKRLVCGWALLLSVGVLQGQNVKTDTIAGKVHNIPVVEVRGQKTVSKITTTTGKQSLVREQLADLGVRSVADAVKHFSGAVVRDYGGVGGLKTVSVRNMGAAHTAVSYDGVVVGNSQAGQVDIGKFSLANLGDISLTVGQSSDALQSARMYASAGILQLHTLKPVFADKEKHRLLAQLKVGSFGQLNPYLRYARKISERTNIVMDADYVHTDGDYPFTLVNGDLVTKEKRYNSQISSFHSEINLFHTFGTHRDLDVKAYYYDAKRGLPGSVVLYKQNDKETAWDRNFFVQARYRHAFSDRWTCQWQAKYNHAWNKYQAEGMQFLGGTKVNTFAQNEYYLSGVVQFRPSDVWTFSVAQDGFVNTLRSDVHNQASPVRTTWLSALHIRGMYERWKIEGTLLHTYKHERVKQGEQPEDLKHWSPMLSFSIQPLDDVQLYLRGMYKHTFRVPTFNDLYYDEIGTRFLLPEKANEYTLGLTFGGQTQGVLHSFAITADAYFNEVKDKIVAFPTTFVWRMLNYGKAHITGVDLGVSSHWKFNKALKCDLSGSFTYQSSLNLSHPQEKSYRHQLPYSPQVFGNVSALFYTPYANVGYVVMGVGKRYASSQNIKDNEIEGYLEHSLSLSRTFRLKGCSVRLQADVHNLTNKQYDVIKFYPMPGRSWTITGSVVF